MKIRTASRLPLINSVLLLVTLSSVVHTQPRKNIEPLPQLLPVREQQLMRETWLRKRLDTMLLPMMRRHNIGMWIVTNEEFHADPVTEYIAPPLPYVGRRDFFIFADRGGDKLDRLALVRYPEEALKRHFEILNPPGREIAATLRRVVEERNPKTIALNLGGTRGATGGLTHDAYKFLSETLGQNYSSRFVSAAPLIIEYMDTRLPEELEFYRTAVELTDALTKRAFSNEVITPGKTTVGDVRWWFMQQVNNAGLTVWFQPDLRVQRQSQETGKTQQFLSVAEESVVIQRGDLIHIDCGLNRITLPGGRRLSLMLQRLSARQSNIGTLSVRISNGKDTGGLLVKITLASSPARLPVFCTSTDAMMLFESVRPSALVWRSSSSKLV